MDLPFFLSPESCLRAALTMKMKEYLPRLIFQCRGCQKTLPEEPAVTQHFEVELAALDIPAFRASLDAPAVACPQCGRHNVLWTDGIVSEIEAASRMALAKITASDAP